MKNLILFALLSLSPQCHAQIITTVAGDSTQGYNGDNILATTTELNEPSGVAVDVAGNIYIADRNNNRIRKVSASSGLITTIAGTGTAGFSGDSGLAVLAEINYPYGIALDTLGNIYFSDGRNYRIRKIDTSGVITTIAGNGTFGYNGDSIAATSAGLDPSGLTIDKYSNIYVADFNNDRIRKINASGIITTIAGTGMQGYNGDGIIATTAQLFMPNGVAVDNTGNIYIADYNNSRIRKVNSAGIITTIAGTGTRGYNGDNISADSAEINWPLGITIDGSGNVYIGDTYNYRIRKVNTSGIITTIAGNGFGGYSGDNGLATLAELADPVGVAIDNSGAVYIADLANSRIRRIGWPGSVNKLSASVQNLTVYPNPSSGLFTVSISSNVQAHIQVTITNALGQKVNEATIFTNTPSIIQLDQPNGVYFISAVSPDGIMNKIINIIK